MTTLQIDLLPAASARIFRRNFVRRREAPATALDLRQQQLKELAASADQDLAACAAADLFREFGVSS